MSDPDELLGRAEQLLGRLEGLLQPRPQPTDWEAAVAFRWRPSPSGGYVQAIQRPHRILLEDLLGIDRQKAALERNTAQFARGLPSNHALLWGARGTGKSSLVKALLNRFAGEGLRMVEVGREALADLPDIAEQLAGRPERFVVFCDDLSFETGDTRYKALKVVLDGTLDAPPENVLVYATSNRRHLLPETLAENHDFQQVAGEIHPGEAVDEKVALSDRFGLWLSFYPFDQEAYLHIVFHWLERLGVPVDDAETVSREAVRWALGRGIRSGRSAWHFARDFAGRDGVD